MGFEIIAKDALGRICKIETKHGRIETPTVFPVINPNLLLINPKKLPDYGAQALITNAYIIYRRYRKEAIEKGVHKFLEVEVPVMTDSGSYQLMLYGDLEISNHEILEFQQKIGSDFIVPLDIPTPPDADYESAKIDLEETIRREKEAKELNINSLLVLPVQGSTILDLRRKSAEAAREIGGDIYAIGAIVPLMDAYRFRDLVRIILEVKTILPVEPIHLFGCGHPMIFAMAVALGCDLFDSAAYALFARDDRYLTIYGTKKLSELHYFPCSCPVCTKMTPEEVKELDKRDREVFLAEHNLYATFEEIKVIKEAIKENTLFELVEKRIRAHPNLISAWRLIRDYSEIIEKFDPWIKKKFLYCGLDTLFRPAVKRHASAVKNVDFEKETIIISTDFGILADLYLRPVFGVVPIELLESYPCGHAEIPDEDTIEKEALEMAVENLKDFIKTKKGKKFVIHVKGRWKELIKDLPGECEYVLH
ncbi:MAG: tRNA guanosine(15) transglycosylase TgtA [Archaeoglobaceae archaeon]|nr:tRNA guanosine(15) transglycosylase TgtA [Archaeoglobaceae archaeon]MDW7989980.1 tRNA guanosine(15) transglycosylase TgtA [Archaeoglobaceae archaeon]